MNELTMPLNHGGGGGRESAAHGLRIRRLFISPEHNFFGHHGQLPGTSPAFEAPQIECVAGRGICGDRFFDHSKSDRGQITFFALETYEAMCREFQVWKRPPSVFRRNVITEGADLNALIGEEFEIRGIRFRGTEECKPCLWMNIAFAPGAEEWLAGRGGLRAMILTSGVLAVDAV